MQVSLNDDILKTNCGVPFIFVINKTDCPCPKYEDKYEFILRHIRKVAINSGAAIIYTSTKKKFNIKVLYDYIFNILFNSDFIHRSNMKDKNSYFIPSGYDRFSILKNSDTQHYLDIEFSEMIKNEEEIILNNDKEEEKEIQCEKVDDYLRKIKDRVYKSRKSIFRDELKFGQKKKETENQNKKVEEQIPEKVNKFDVFLKKKEGEPEKPNLSKEERTKLTRETIMNKLNLKKSKNSETNK